MVKIANLEKDTLENLYQDIVKLENYWPLRENIFNLHKEYNRLVQEYDPVLFENFELEYISLLALVYATFSRLAGAHYQLGEVRSWQVKPLPKEHKECFIFETWECFYSDLNRAVNTVVNIIYGICYGYSTKGKGLSNLIKNIKEESVDYLQEILPHLEEMSEILQIRNHIEHYWRPIFFIDEKGEYLIPDNFVKGLLLSHQGSVANEDLVNITEKAENDIKMIEKTIDIIFDILNKKYLPRYFKSIYLEKND